MGCGMYPGKPRFRICQDFKLLNAKRNPYKILVAPLAEKKV
jgi:hypothetical protein